MRACVRGHGPCSRVCHSGKRERWPFVQVEHASKKRSPSILDRVHPSSKSRYMAHMIASSLKTPTVVRTDLVEPIFFGLEVVSDGVDDRLECCREEMTMMEEM